MSIFSYCPVQPCRLAPATVHYIGLAIGCRLVAYTQVNLSALIRQALQEHLKRLQAMELEARDRRGYQARPQRIEEYRPW
jgi:hypothetical protein